MIRACFLGNASYPQPLDRRSERRFAALARLGEMNVVAFSADGRLRTFEEHARLFLLPRLRSSAARQAAMLLGGGALALDRVLRGGAEVLVAQGPHEGAAAAAVKLLARLLGRRVALVIEGHGDFEEGPFLQRRVPFRGLVDRALRSLARFAFAHADAVRAVSSATETQLRRWAPGLPVVRFAAWTDLNLFLSAGEARRPAGCQLGRAPGAAPTALFAGVLVEGKGVHVLLDAWAAVRRARPDARLLLAGAPKDADYVRRLRAQADRAGGVELLGPLPQAALARRMAEADVFVLPSLSEGLGLVLIEAMACGTPVIASRVGGTPDLVREGENGFLVPPGDAAAIADRVLRLFGRPDEGREMGRRGRGTARSVRLEEAFVDGYRALFSAALSRAASAAW